jgi:hypothetical protein
MRLPILNVLLIVIGEIPFSFIVFEKGWYRCFQSLTKVFIGRKAVTNHRCDSPQESQVPWMCRDCFHALFEPAQLKEEFNHASDCLTHFDFICVPKLSIEICVP